MSVHTLRALYSVAVHMAHLPDTAEYRAAVWPDALGLTRGVSALSQVLHQLGAIVGRTCQRARELGSDDPTLFDDRH